MSSDVAFQLQLIDTVVFNQVYMVYVLIPVDVDFGYSGRPLLFENLNFGVDMDSRSMCKFYIQLV